MFNEFNIYLTISWQIATMNSTSDFRLAIAQGAQSLGMYNNKHLIINIYKVPGICCNKYEMNFIHNIQGIKS